MLINRDVINYFLILKSKQNLKLILNKDESINVKRDYNLIIKKIDLDQLINLDLHNILKLLQTQKFDNFNIYNKLKLSKIRLTPKIDLRSLFPPIYNQGSLSSCTANALCGIIAFERKGLIGSRLFLYYNERVLSNNVDIDNGAYLSDGIISLKNKGICLEKDWPYTKNYATKPSPICYKNALKYRASSVYYLNNTILEMKQCLINKDPFVLGIAIFSSFETYNVQKTGFVPMPNIDTDEFLGGHAVVCVGYNDNLTKNNVTGYWIMRNSWGTTWGDRGYFYLPYAYLTDDNLASDMWCIKKI